MDTPASVAVLAHLQCRTDLHTEAAGPINTEHVYIYMFTQTHNTHTHTKKTYIK